MVAGLGGAAGRCGMCQGHAYSNTATTNGYAYANGYTYRNPNAYGDADRNSHSRTCRQANGGY